VDFEDAKAITEGFALATESAFLAAFGEQISNFEHLHRISSGISMSMNFEEFAERSRSLYDQIENLVDTKREAFVLGWIHAWLTLAATLAAGAPRTDLLTAIPDRVGFVTMLYNTRRDCDGD